MIVAVILLAVITIAFKAVGPAVLGDREFPPRLRAAVDALPVALLAGLLAVGLLGPGWRTFDWTVLPGLALAVALRLWRRSPLTCVVAGVAATAVVRALPWG